MLQANKIDRTLISNQLLPTLRTTPETQLVLLHHACLHIGAARHRIVPSMVSAIRRESFLRLYVQREIDTRLRSSLMMTLQLASLLTHEGHAQGILPLPQLEILQ
jgi:hypothetical protein